MMKTSQNSDQSIILIRHGETEWNRLHRFQGRTDIPLNERGLGQANALALALRDEPVTAIHTSPLTRAVETARHIQKFHPTIPFVLEPGLIEMDLGDFEGMDGKQWAADHLEFRKTWERAPAALSMPGGESLKKVQSRSVKALKHISASYSAGSTLILCSHNFVIASLVCFASNTPLDQFRTVKQETAALNILATNGTNWRVEKINDRSHLA